MTDFHIREAIETDVPTLLGFVRDLARYEKAEHEVEATVEILAGSLFGDTRYAQALIAERGGEPAGFALYFFNFSTWQGRPGLYLEDLYVAPEHRGNGVGEALLRELAGIAVEHRCGRFEWSVLDWNEPAIRFYEKLGAESQSEWVKYRLSGRALELLAEVG